MVIVPTEKPVVENLNSYYIDVKKLCEHCQGEFGSGGIHFKSPSATGVIFFDKDELLTGAFQDKEGKIQGKEAIDRLLKALGHHNFTITVNEIDLEMIYFWANMPGAEKIYKDLSTEFTDLEGLIRKMGAEKLTGYIDVSVSNGEETGLIFLHDGHIIGGSYSWGSGKACHSKENCALLIQKAKQSGGTFQVSKVSLTKACLENERNENRERLSSSIFSMVEELLRVLEKLVASNKKVRIGFRTLLKRKFIEQADKYAFLDPFIGEFEYFDQKITFLGDTSAEEVAKGVVESVWELADELGILPKFMKELNPWFHEHVEKLARCDIHFS